jgi:hypothetical protein
MPSITNYTETLKPFSPIGMRSYATIPLLCLMFIFFLGQQLQEEYFRFTTRQAIAAAEMWPTEIATIEKVTPTTVYLRDGRYAHHNEYKLRVEYKYSVKGAQQYAVQENFLEYPHRFGGFAFGNQKPALSYKIEDEKAIEQEYTVGTHHTVRYDPEHPGNSFVDTKIQPEGPQDQQRRSILIGSAIFCFLIFAIVSSGITKMR